MTQARLQLPWLEVDTPFPDAARALRHPAHLNGLVAAGADLSVPRLMEAYRKGIFPWFSEGQPILWWSPDPRMVLSTQNFRIHTTFKKTLRQFRRQSECVVRIDSSFRDVIRQCAHRPRPGQSGTWIVPDMVSAYEGLHQAGIAHSVETWVGGELVGGLYVVSIGKAIFGESMFTLKRDASKIALTALVAFARAHQMPWIDCQQNTRHLASLGASEMDRRIFLEHVAKEAAQPGPVWNFESIYWDAIDPLA